jgi:hypothetical protein
MHKVLVSVDNLQSHALVPSARVRWITGDLLFAAVALQARKADVP